MKALLWFGWISFGVDVALLGMMFATRNMGDDAAGRGLATGWAMVLTPIVLAAGGALYWSQRRQSFSGVLVTACITGLPFLILAKNMAMAPVSAVSRGLRNIGKGSFHDAVLTRMAGAIEQGDTTALRALTAQGPRDWSARDHHGRTILGIAVEAGNYKRQDPRWETMVRVLVDAGARYQDDALEPNGRMFSDLVYDSGDDQAGVMDLLLRAGANANDTEKYDGRPLLLHGNMTVAKARVLIAHGADLLGIRDTRSDRLAWNALMNATYMRNWTLASYYLSLGCDPSYRTPSGETIDEAFAQVANEDGPPEGHRYGPDYEAFRAQLDSARKAPRH